MRNKPFSSSSYAAPCEWKSTVQTINNAEVSVYQPVQTTTPVVVTTPSLSVGNDPTFSVNKIKRTVAEILADTTHAPITCQALIDSANTAVFASTDPINGYHTLPVSGKKIHEHFSSGNISELKTSGNIITTAGLVGIKINNPASELDVDGRIQATGDVIVVDGAIGIGTTTPSSKLQIANGGITTSHRISAGKDTNGVSYIGRARIESQSFGNSSSVHYGHHDCTTASNYSLIQTNEGETKLNSESGFPLTFRIGGNEKMRVHSNGFVGINKLAPTEALEIGGNIKTTGTGTITASGDITTSGNVVATNIKNYYQTTNSLNSTVGDNGGSTHSTNAGCPSPAGDWLQYNSWKTTGVDTVNSNTNVFSPKTYGFEALVAGTYKITVNMAFQTDRSNQLIVIRLAKNGLNDELQNSTQENPGPLAGSGFIPGYFNGGKTNSFGAAGLTHIMTLDANDKVSVYTTNVGQIHSGTGQNSFTREGYSQFLAEYLG